MLVECFLSLSENCILKLKWELFLFSIIHDRSCDISAIPNKVMFQP